jgi:hypothetical protein
MTPAPTLTPDPSGFIYTYPLPFDKAVLTVLTVGAVVCFIVGIALTLLLIHVLFASNE